MFDQHQPTISRWAQAHPANFAKVQLLTILSARQPFDRVAEDFNAVLSGDDRPLFAWKLEAWRQAQEQSADRLAKLQSINRMSVPIRDREVAMLVEVASWSGFGFVKGGFVLQMVFGLVGCLDTRNEHAYGLSQFRTPKTSRARHKAALKYSQLCRKLGGCAFLWDAWCAGYVRGRLSDAWQVSAEHCCILGLDPGSDASDIPFDMAA